MELSTILRPEAIRLISTETSKKRLFQKLGDLAASAYELPSQQVTEALMERETLGPTGVGKGIALPHARLPDIDKVLGVFVRLDKPVDFDAVDRQPVDLVFALFAPVESGVDHLKALALVSRTLRDGAICDKLRANVEPSTLFTVLTDSTASEAAA
jgi:PTS system nitrogen regulatory IIA component